MTQIIDGTRVSTPAPLAGPSTGAGISPDRIYSLWQRRKNKAHRIIAAGEAVRKVYEGDWETALPELEKRERIQVANLVNQGIEQDAMRIASTAPTMSFAPESTTKAARDRAATRTQTLYAWHEKNSMPLKRRWRARQLISLATSPVYIRPGPDMIPVWETWDPLSTFPSDTAPDDYVPHDVIYHFKRSWQWLQDTYQLGGRLPLGKNGHNEGMIDCLLYCDADEMTMVAIGKDDDGAPLPPTLLQRVPNLTHEPCVIVPGRITLGRLMGQFEQMIGMYEAQGLLWAMHVQALKRAIFSETWAVGRPNEQLNIVVPANGMTGEIGQIEGGVLQEFRTDPSVQTGQTLDRIERNLRLTGGIPQEYGGESGSNIRTGRRGQQVLSSQIDFMIQENQDILAASTELENRVAIRVAKAYWPTTPKTLYVKFGDGAVTYTPVETFPSEEHTVAYPFSGVSADGLVIEGLQRVGAGTMSEDRFMEIDPMIEDPVFEKSRIIAGQIEKALLSSIQTQAADPNSAYTPEDMAWLLDAVRARKLDLSGAITALQERKQKAQAAAAQGQLSDQQMQPGLAQAGAPGTPQAAVGGPPQPTPDQQGLGALMGALRNVNRGVAPNQSQQPPQVQG